MVLEFVNEYGTTILYSILVAVFSYIGSQVKKIYEKYVDTKVKKEVVEATCKYVEQIYSSLNGEEKLNKALEAASEMLVEKGISVSELELRVLIEASVNSFKQGYEKGTTSTPFKVTEGGKLYATNAVINGSMTLEKEE